MKGILVGVLIGLIVGLPWIGMFLAGWDFAEFIRGLS